MIDTGEFQHRCELTMRADIRHILYGDSIVRKVTKPADLPDELYRRALKAACRVFEDMSCDRSSGADTVGRIIDDGLLPSVYIALDRASA